MLLTRFYFFVIDPCRARASTPGWFLTAVLAARRRSCLAGRLVVRDVLHPELDVVRADGVDDPAGRVLDGAPDRGSGGSAGAGRRPP